MAKGTYGSPGKNEYTISGLVGQFSNVVNAVTGVVQIYKRQTTGPFGTGSFVSIGTYNPKGGGFTPQADNPAFLSEDELRILSSAESILKIKNYAVTTAVNANANRSAAHELIFGSSVAPPTNPPQPPTQGATPPAQQEAQGAGTQEATPAGTQGAPGTPPASEVPQIETTPTPSLIIANESLYYPKDLGSTNSYQDIIKFTAKQITVRKSVANTTPTPSPTPPPTPAPNADGASSTETDSQTQPPENLSFFEYDVGRRDGDGIEDIKDEKPVFIAIQPSITDTNAVDWSSGEFSAIQAAAFKISLGLAQGSSTNAKDILTALGDEAKKYESRIQRIIAGSAASAENILARTDGIAINPNLELLFNKPTLRSFNFTFKMSARDSKEAEIIKKIIKFFKYHMAVRKEEGGLFLMAPHVFGIEYIHRYYDGKEQKTINNHPGLNKIKTCALTNFSVDYTPNGSYMTYGDGTMVAYTMTMQFQELTPIYDDDYAVNNENTKFHKIGF